MADMIFVVSSNIEAIGYDQALSELHIRFSKTGKTYVYQNVPIEFFEQLMAADSKGSFFNRVIKPAFEYRVA